MNEQVLALVGVLVGLIGIVVGTILSVRVQRLEREVRRRTMPPPAFVEAYAPRRGETVLAGRVRFGGEGGVEVNPTVEKAGTPRTGDQQRTVEVQRDDGSTATLGIDPTDPDSVHTFLDDARRVRARRIVAVTR